MNVRESKRVCVVEDKEMKNHQFEKAGARNKVVKVDGSFV